MTEHKNNCCAGTSCSQRGNAIIIALVVLIVAAVGVMAYMSGKLNLPQQDNKTEAAAVDAPVMEDVSRVLAVVNGQEIKRQDVIDLVNVMPQQMQQIPTEQLGALALEQLIANKIVDGKASSAHLDNNEDVKKQMKEAKTQIIRSKFVEDSINDELTEDRAKAEYEKYIKNFPKVEEVGASHILVEDEKTAKDLIEKLNKGGSFEDLAKENSKDGSSENGGSLGYFAENEVVPEFAKAAFSTKVGEYTKAPVKTQFGYHIVKVTDKRERAPATFEQAKPYIEQELRRKIMDELITAWKSSADIQLFDAEGNPVPKATPDAVEPAAAQEGDEPAAVDASAPVNAEVAPEEKTAE